MKSFYNYTKDIIFGGNKKRNLPRIYWTPFSDELLISIVLALSDKMPAKIYGEAIAIEIGRLESLGETIIEHFFVIYTITNQSMLNHHFIDIEN
jgi:hypothetical protein